MHPRPIELLIEHGKYRQQAIDGGEKMVVGRMLLFGASYDAAMSRSEAAYHLRTARRMALQRPALLRLQ
jgi:hypothetical protein